MKKSREIIVGVLKEAKSLGLHAQAAAGYWLIAGADTEAWDLLKGHRGRDCIHQWMSAGRSKSWTACIAIG